MYNLNIGTQRVTNLRLSGRCVAGIFTGTITKMERPGHRGRQPGADPARAQDRAGGALGRVRLDRPVHPVDDRHPESSVECVLRARSAATRARRPRPTRSLHGLGDDRPVRRPRRGRATSARARPSARSATSSTPTRCRPASRWPRCSTRPATTPNRPPATSRCSLLAGTDQHGPSNPTTYLTQNLSGVYTNRDRAHLRAVLVLVHDPADDDRTSASTPTRGYTLGDFGKYLLCQGQTQVDALGYSALPINLVEAGFAQLQKVPGASVPTATTDIIRSLQQPDVLHQRHQHAGQQRSAPAGLRQAGPDPVHHRYRRSARRPTPVKPGARVPARPTPAAAPV